MIYLEQNRIKIEMFRSYLNFFLLIDYLEHIFEFKYSLRKLIQFRRELTSSPRIFKIRYLENQAIF